MDTEVSGMVLAFYLIVMVLMMAGNWRIFEKAGRPGWQSIVPVFNIVQMFRIAGKSGWRLLLLFIPLVNFFVLLGLFMDLAKAFGKGRGFGLGMVFLPFVFAPILGFDASRYQGTGEVAPAAPSAMPPPSRPNPPQFR